MLHHKMKTGGNSFPATLAEAQKRMTRYIESYVELCDTWPEIRYEQNGLEFELEVTGPGPNGVLQTAMTNVLEGFEQVNDAYPRLVYRPGHEQCLQLFIDDDTTIHGGGLRDHLQEAREAMKDLLDQKVTRPTG